MALWQPTIFSKFRKRHKDYDNSYSIPRYSHSAFSPQNLHRPRHGGCDERLTMFGEEIHNPLLNPPFQQFTELAGREYSDGDLANYSGQVRVSRDEIVGIGSMCQRYQVVVFRIVRHCSLYLAFGRAGTFLAKVGYKVFDLSLGHVATEARTHQHIVEFR